MKKLTSWKKFTASSGFWQILLIQKPSYHILCTIQEATFRITIHFCKNLQRLTSTLSWQVTRPSVLDLLFTITHSIHCSILANLNCLWWRPSVNALGRNWLILTELVNVITSVWPLFKCGQLRRSPSELLWMLINHMKYFQDKITHKNACWLFWVFFVIIWFVLSMSCGAI